ncbi:hypothetical protein MK137Hg11_000126200 [Dysgonomonas reticulitermitis]
MNSIIPVICVVITQRNISIPKIIICVFIIRVNFDCFVIIRNGQGPAKRTVSGSRARLPYHPKRGQQRQEDTDGKGQAEVEKADTKGDTQKEIQQMKFNL